VTLTRLERDSEAPDLYRPVVCPDTGEAFKSAVQAARVMRGRGYDAESRDVLKAIETGDEYCMHYWDFRWPVGREPEGD
jgi:hypothetical protein